MKRLILATGVAAMLLGSAPAMANNDWVAPLVGGLVVGGIIGNEVGRNHRHDVYVEEYYYAPPPRHRHRHRHVTRCWEVEVYDAWGDFAGYRTVCRRR